MVPQEKSNLNKLFRNNKVGYLRPQLLVADMAQKVEAIFAAEVLNHTSRTDRRQMQFS